MLLNTLLPLIAIYMCEALHEVQ